MSALLSGQRRFLEVALCRDQPDPPLSTAHNNHILLRPYDEIDKSVPDLKLTVLPGRLAALSHPLNKGRMVLLPDREWYDPDLATVASSGINLFKKGDVVVLAPDHGAFFPQKENDARELRIVGVACPWWESVLATYDQNGLHPAPGWILVEFGSSEVRKSGRRVVRTPEPKNHRTQTATVIASHGDHHSEPHKGQRVCIAGMRTYAIRHESQNHRTTEAPNEQTLALVRAPIASKQWLTSLQTNN